MNHKSSSTKHEILKMLKLQKRLTVSEMAKQLGITEMAVRRHLSTLERDQLVYTTLVRQAMGRPMNVYELSEKGEELFPQNYKQIALDFLKDIESVAGQDVVEKLFQNRKERIKQMYEEQFANKSFDEKMIELARIQNKHGYMTELRKDEDGTYHFIEHHCPIAEVAKEYQTACDCERQLFQQLLGTLKVTSQACMAKGDDVCHYEIKKHDYVE
ncbi:helix-turn-helix transcriptional regulator [Bacillus alveayuensis]|jgi:DeoR family transcriptional regulator, suf operon transcriptional repressor|uniref:helix-turn-helix transcriptional regulator n=1 Tax=Aeribacillus alveayuensis TaxID=279215 RepID=UPI0005CC9541|nr:metalloregulator ArsR/SmtB family transcription factor [Bacillus alveayuensis]